MLATWLAEECSQTVLYLFIPPENIHSAAILRFASASLQFFERTKSVEKLGVKSYSLAVEQIWVALLIKEQYVSY